MNNFRWVLIVSALIFFNTTFSQNQKQADSLKVLLVTETDDSVRMNLLRLISLKSSSPSEIIHYGNELLNLAIDKQDKLNEIAAYGSLGSGFRLNGNLEKSLEYLLLSAKIAEEYGFSRKLGEAYAEVGTLYSINGDPRNSVLYKKLAMDIFLTTGDSLLYAITLMNLGNEYYHLEKFDSAILSFGISQEIFELKSFDNGIAYVIGNRAIVKLAQGLVEESESDFNRAISILEPVGDLYAIADFQNELGKVYVKLDDKAKAIETITKGLEIAKEIDIKAQIRDASELLADLHKENGDFEEAFKYYEQFVAYKDSIQNTETVRKLANQRTEFEIGQAEAAMSAERQTQQVINVALFFGLALLTVFGVAQYRNSRQRMATNQILRDQKSELENQKAKLEEVNRTKDRFFSIISHDLRGPVNAFHGVSRMIKFFVQNKQIDQLEVLAEEIDQSVDRLSSLLDNLLNWAVQQQGEFPYVPEKIEIKTMADDLVDVFTTMAKSKHIALSSSVPEDLHAWADRNTTMTIIRNLVSNALKFTPRDGYVTINAQSKDDCVAIEVHDNGVGIPKEKLGHLFELNEENSTWGTEGEKGLGLGLQLVHEFVELNQGQIIVDSKDGQGTTFTVKLPTYDLKQIQTEAG